MSSPLPAIVLAAGAGRRFGAPKLLVPLEGRPLICHSLEAAIGSAALGPIVVVVAAGDEALEATVGEHFSAARLVLARNPDPARGILSSFRTGLEALPPDFEGVMVLLADMPYLTPATIDRLSRVYRQQVRAGPPKIIIPDCEGDRYHPRLFPKPLLEHFFAVAEGAPESGSRVYRLLGDSVLRVKVGEEGEFRDVDVAEDLR